MKLFEGEKQFNCKADLWKAVKTSVSERELAKVKKIKYTDNRLTNVS